MKGYGVGEKHSQDPINSQEPRGKNRERRKHRDDGNTLTPTEAHIKNKLMRQFMRAPDGTDLASVEAYKAASCWCSGCDGRRLAMSDGLCNACWVTFHDSESRLLGPDATTPHPDSRNP